MAARHVGLDIGTHAVRAAEITVARDGVTTLTRFGQVALAPGAVIAGEVAEPDLVAAALQRLWREVGFTTRQVIVGVGNQRVVIRSDTLPEMDDDELRTAIEFRADELIPIPRDEAIIDFSEVERSVDAAGEASVEVMVVGAQRDMVDSVRAAVERAGLSIAMVDLVPFALVRALADDGLGGLDDSDLTEDAIVCVGAGVSTVIVHELGRPRFARILTVGSDALTDGLARELDLDHEAAEGLKRRVVEGRAEPELADRARPVINDQMVFLVDEIRSSIDYHLAQTDRPLRRIVLTGGGSRLPDISDRLRALIGVDVVRGDPFSRLNVGDTGLTEGQLAQAIDLAAVPVGLALAGRARVGAGRRLDLLPPEVASRRAARRQGVLVGAGAAALVALLGGLWFQRNAAVGDAEDEAAAAEARVVELRAEIAEYASVQALESEVAERQGLVEAALRNDVAWTKLIQEVATVMPDDTWLTSFQGTAPTDAAAGTFTVAANGYDHTSAARWLLRLAPLPSVQSLWVPSSSIAADETGFGEQESSFGSQAVLSPEAASDRADDYVSTFPTGDADPTGDVDATELAGLDPTDELDDGIGATGDDAVGVTGDDAVGVTGDDAVGVAGVGDDPAAGGGTR